ncbi:MAG: 30S ribosomal protein S1 [Calditrichota bacterium]
MSEPFEPIENNPKDVESPSEALALPVISPETGEEPTHSPAPPQTPPEAPFLFVDLEAELPDPEMEIYDLSELGDEDEYTPEERARLEARYLETMKVFRSGELVMGRIVAVHENSVAVDIGFKSEGNIPLEEFDNVPGLKVGSEIEVCIDSIEDSEGTLVLSKRKAEFIRVWEKINNLFQTGEMVEAPIVRRIKGGMVVDLFGIEAFLPGSQIDVHPVRDFDALVGMSMDFRIIKVNHARKNVVLSHKVLVEESLREIRQKVLAELEEGQVVEGQIKNITDFGVFVDLGGVDGLLHITDLSWGRVAHPSDIVKLDERIKVKVLHYDKERQRISLGLKQLQEHHWDKIEERFPLQTKAKGKIISIVKYGAFVELEPGIEGLVHISEMSWTQHIKHPSQMVSVGDEIDVVVLNVDRENRKISLGMKQVEEDPWERLEDVYQSGTRHKGTVRDLVPFGAFIELEPGIDGLIHISDLSWTRKVRHPGEIVKKGQEIEVVILNFDKNERRIALGFKQLEDDPWDRFEHEYPIRARTEGSVIRVLEKGVVVMLHMGVEGFIPNSQLGKNIGGENKKKIKEGDNLELEVIEFDKSNHRIVLSHAIVERGKERAAYRSFQDSADENKTTIADLVKPTGEGETEVVEGGRRRREFIPAGEVPPDSTQEAEPYIITEPVVVDAEPLEIMTAEPQITESEPESQIAPPPMAEPTEMTAEVEPATSEIPEPEVAKRAETESVETPPVDAEPVASEPAETNLFAVEAPAEESKETPPVDAEPAKNEPTEIEPAVSAKDKPEKTKTVKKRTSRKAVTKPETPAE